MAHRFRPKTAEARGGQQQRQQENPRLAHCAGLATVGLLLVPVGSAVPCNPLSRKAFGPAVAAGVAYLPPLAAYVTRAQDPPWGVTTGQP